ncbi:sensor domain-containing diguanylate cyclase [Jannaschia seosinensis]|nr:sensor domain-containing diguanylate cyclase [Jannaschia seosinensis]
MEAARLSVLHHYGILDSGSEPAFDRITGLVRQIFDMPFSGISLIEADRHWFKSRSGSCVEELPREISFCAHVIRHSEPTCVQDTLLEETFRDNPFVTGEPNVRSYLGAPLVTAEGFPIGALCATDTKPRVFDDGQIAIMKSLAALVMDHFDLREMAGCDGLTGLLTRRAWLDLANKEIVRAHRENGPAAVVIFDLDHFKNINDLHGHAAGDAVLTALGKMVRQEGRVEHPVGRIGGEEFAMVIPDAGVDEAAAAAERFRVSAESLAVEFEGKRLKPTVSVGVAAFSEQFVNAEQWLAAADVALYRAKAEGRNCVRVLDRVVPEQYPTCGAGWSVSTIGR